MRKTTILLLMYMTLTACHHAAQHTGIDPANLDTTQVAQNDFYQFATGGWQSQHPLPDDYSRFGSFDLLARTNMEQVNSLIKDLSATPQPQGSVARKIGDIYNLALDTARRNREGAEPIREYMEQIKALTDRGQLSQFLGSTMECGFFALYVDADARNSSMNILNEYQAGFELGERDYYLDDDDHTRMIRTQYLKHIAKMFELYGCANGEQAAATVLRLETRLAKAAFSNVELRDPVANYNKMSIDSLGTLVPQIDWSAYLNAAGIHTDTISVGQVRHLQEVGHLLAEEPLEDIRVLLSWQLLNGCASFLSDDFFQEHFHFYGQILSGQPEPSPLWKRAVAMVNGTLGEAVGQMYVKTYFPKENKERMLALVKNLQTSLGQRIDAQEWMSDTTKQKAHEKLDAFTIKIGYPDTWRDYSALVIDPSMNYYANIRRAAIFERDYSLSYLDKPVDRTKWYMTPQTVNAYYNPSTNEICFPAGILQYPFFDMQADDAFNYGAIGVVIGHEMTHGFDDQGCQFDKDGNLTNWWTESDKTQFDQRTDVMKRFFDGIEVAPGVHANGAFTLGENIADHGGLEISFHAFNNLMQQQGIDPFTTTSNDSSAYTCAQRFFLAYANVWAANIRPEEILQRTKSDPHSLGRWRVNGALPHIDAWYKAWQVTPDNSMYINPENRVHIW